MALTPEKLLKGDSPHLHAVSGGELQHVLLGGGGGVSDQRGASQMHRHQRQVGGGAPLLEREREGGVSGRLLCNFS